MTTYLELEPGRAKTKNYEKMWGDPEWVAEEKLDGWRFLMHYGGDLPRVFLTGRRQSVDTGFKSERGENVPGLWPRMLIAPSGYTVFDGEVMPPVGADYRDLNAIVGKTSPDKAAEAVQRLGEPRYVMFDILFFDGEDVRTKSWYERRAILENIMPIMNNPQISLVRWSYDHDTFYDQICREKGEGIILKEISGGYGEDWIKVKKTVTLDVIITGFTKARFGRTGKFDGLIGAAKISVYMPNGTLIEIGQVSGMVDAVRIDMTNHPENWLGHVLEVRCARFAKERLWHPRYERPRPDVDPRTATLVKMMADLGREDANAGKDQLSLF